MTHTSVYVFVRNGETHEDALAPFDACMDVPRYRDEEFDAAATLADCERYLSIARYASTAPEGYESMSDLDKLKWFTGEPGNLEIEDGEIVRYSTYNLDAK